MRILLYLAIGFGVGSVSGALGIGGGILLVPALMWLCGFEPTKAAGTSLAVLMMPSCWPAAWRYYVEKQMSLEAAIWIALAFSVGGYLGASSVQNLPQSALRFFFGMVMIYVAIRFILASSSEAASAAAGLSALLVAWLGFIGLRALGRKHVVVPELGTLIRMKKEEIDQSPDYYI